ncbi:uncharacterized protein LOC117340644 [Pecten maximus]|uniref:uncharacterized protein LOC117340644 n=1 Tax=Pecten maximus TaxID=6579 RepID=UPI0014585759|nr:uncharacterized protein LOC117340644 [Pecten maximus]
MGAITVLPSIPRQDPRVKLNNDFGLATTETLVMNAIFLSNPEPTFSWSFETSPGTGVTKLVNGSDNFDIQNKFIATNLSAVSVGTRKNIQASWFGVYNVTAKNSQGSDTLSFTAAAKGKPDSPYGGLAMCPFEDRATLSWRSGFNGGSSQTFIVGIRTDTQSSIMIDRNINQSDPGRGQSVTTTVTGLTADTKHFFTVYAVNEFGNSSLLEEVNCTTQARPAAGSSLTGPIIGTVCGVVVVLIVIAAVIVIKRRNSGKKSRGDDGDMVGIDNRSADDDSEGGLKPNILYESADTGLKPNILYESAGPLPGTSSEYAVVDKPSKKKPVSPDAVYAIVDKSKNEKSESAKDLYAEVKLKSKNGKEKKKQGKGKQKGGHGKAAEKNDVYANCKEADKNAPATGRQANKDGLIYLDVVFKNGDKGTTGVTHGIENRTDYADVDFSKQAPSLPPESGNEQTKEDGK